MRWPWVSRSIAVRYRKLWRHAIVDVRRLNAQLAENRGANAVLVEALSRSETERVDLQMRLLRTGYGLSPFPELAQPDLPAAPAAPAAPPGTSVVNADMSPDEIKRVYVAEALSKYGSGNMRKIRNHVELRLAEYYQFRHAPDVLTAAERAQANAVERDVEAAIAEGRAAAAGNGGI